VAEYIKWANTARLFRDITITEKLDGTNACVIFERLDPQFGDSAPENAVGILIQDDAFYGVFAQSRNRLITPSNDNAGFAKWVEQNYQQLFYVLGEGRHYGEWWGQGIGRKYDMDRKVFSVFNTAGWFSENMGDTRRVDRAELSGIDIDAVPVLYQGSFSEDVIRQYANQLRIHGSYATKKYTDDYFMYPEGICIYHKGADTVFKYTLDGNDKHKWEIETPTVKRTLVDKLLRRK
jgi:hypothetical protein